MKIQAIGVIDAMTQNSEEKGLVDVSLRVNGKVDEGPQSAKDAWAQVELAVKSLVAEKLHFGQRLYVTISTEPFKEE